MQSDASFRNLLLEIKRDAVRDQAENPGIGESAVFLVVLTVCCLIGGALLARWAEQNND